MSRNAAKAMRILAEELDAEAQNLPNGMAWATISAMARAHHNAADRIERELTEPTVTNVAVPSEFMGGAGQLKTARDR